MYSICILNDLGNTINMNIYTDRESATVHWSDITSLDPMWNGKIAPHKVLNVKVCLISDAVMSFEEKGCNNPFRNPCRGILFRARIIDIGPNDHVLDQNVPSRQEYGEYVGLHVVITMEFDRYSVNPTRDMAMTRGWEGFVSGDFEGVYDGKCQFASYFVIRAEVIWNMWIMQGRKSHV